MSRSTALRALLASSLLISSNAHAFLTNYWPMDDVSGLVAAPAIGGKDAVFQVDQADLIWDSGIIGGAANLSGAIGAYFRVDLNGAIPFGTNGATIALWINPISSNQDYEGVFMTRSTSNLRFSGEVTLRLPTRRCGRSSTHSGN